jgi:threonine dehydrogenase-like Zn-dependent dehydrogenase
MLAIVRRDNAVYLDRDAAAPEPALGEAVIRPTLCAVAPSDLAVARGDVPHTGVMGHQFVGVVESVNLAPSAPDRHKSLPGKRVVGDINIVDATSELARRGLGLHEPTRSVLGLVNRDGCYAERFTLPVGNLTVVPDDIPDHKAVFAEPLAAAVHASQIVRLEGKQYVTVLGDNVSAMLCAQVMAKLNHSVRLLGQRPERFGLAERWGVKHRHMDEVGRRQDQDVVVDCTGEADTIELALALVRPRGKVILKVEPVPLPGLPIPRGRGPDLTMAILNEVEMIGARCGRTADAIAMLSNDGKGGFDFSEMVSKTYKLADGIAALRAASAPAAIKILIEC